MKFERSQNCSKLMKALAAAQSKITNAARSTKNEFGKYSYATLEDILSACKSALTEQGVFFTQLPGNVEFHEGHSFISLRTDIYLEDEWMSHEFQCPVKRAKDGSVGPQEMGSAITYARKYALSAIFGIAQSDDDGQGAAYGQQGASSRRRGAVYTPQQDQAAQAAAETLTAAEAQVLEGLINETNSPMAAVLNYFGISRLSDLPKSRFNEAVGVLERKKAQQAAAAAAPKKEAPAAPAPAAPAAPPAAEEAAPVVEAAAPVAPATEEAPATKK